MRPGRAGPHRRPCSCRFLRQVLVARRMWQAMRPKLQQYQPVIARLQPQLLPRRPAQPTAQILSSETAAIPTEAAMTRTPVSAATNRHMSVARGPGKACARAQRNGGSRAFCRALLVRRCQRPSVVRGSGGAWSGVVCAILIRCSESVALESTKKLLNITSA